jgi:putative MATE family efflux protein
MIMGIFSILLINVVDTIYIGQLGLIELAGVSFTFPVVFMVMSVPFGIGIGTSAVVARSIGKGNHSEVRRLTTDSLYLTFFVMTIVAVVGLVTIDPIFTLMGATREMLPFIRDYMIVWYFGVGMVALPIVGNNAIRATGDSKTPSFIMMSIAIINAILDPFLIFGIGPFPMMGVEGAAMATVISYFFAFVGGLWVLGKRERMLEKGFPIWDKVFLSWRRILYIAIPATMSNMLAPVASAVLTWMVAGYGADAVAAFGIGTRLEALAMLGVMALTSILTPFVAQNLGAKNIDRIQISLVYSSKFSLLWGLAAFVILGSAAYPLSIIFSDNEGVQSLTRAFLWIVPMSFGFFGLSMISSALCNALNKPIESFSIQILRLFVLVLPLGLIGSWSFGVLGIFGGIFLGNVISGIVGILWVKVRVLPKTEK